MSDYGESRPSKRRRRDSSSPPRSRERYSQEHRDQKPRSERRPDDQERRRRRSRDREYNSERGQREPTSSSRQDSRDRHRSQRRHRSRSRSHDRSKDTNKHKSRSYNRSRSPESDNESDRHRHKHKSRHHDHSRSHNHNHNTSKRDSPKPLIRSKAALPSQNDAFTSTSANPNDTSATVTIEKQKPNFKPTGKLAAASNTIQTANQSIVLKYQEPSEGRKPAAKDGWRMYVFKGEEIVDTVELAGQSCWLIGREVAVVDLAVEHPSCSKQHAVIQFRYVEKRNEFGDRVGKVKPYVLDLESANGTMLNEAVIPSAKYVELRDKDVVRFGHSSREYVIQLPPKA